MPAAAVKPTLDPRLRQILVQHLIDTGDTMIWRTELMHSTRVKLFAGGGGREVEIMMATAVREKILVQQGSEKGDVLYVIKEPNVKQHVKKKSSVSSCNRSSSLQTQMQIATTRLIMLQGVPPSATLDDCRYYCEPFGILRSVEWRTSDHLSSSARDVIVKFKYIADAQALCNYPRFTIFKVKVPAIPIHPNWAAKLVEHRLVGGEVVPPEVDTEAKYETSEERKRKEKKKEKKDKNITSMPPDKERYLKPDARKRRKEMVNLWIRTNIGSELRICDIRRNLKVLVAEDTGAEKILTATTSLQRAQKEELEQLLSEARCLKLVREDLSIAKNHLYKIVNRTTADCHHPTPESQVSRQSGVGAAAAGALTSTDPSTASGTSRKQPPTSIARKPRSKNNNNKEVKKESEPPTVVPAGDTPEEEAEYHRPIFSPTVGDRYDITKDVRTCDLCETAEGASRLPINRHLDAKKLPTQLIGCHCQNCQWVGVPPLHPPVAAALNDREQEEGASPSSLVIAYLCHDCYNGTIHVFEEEEEEDDESQAVRVV